MAEATDGWSDPSQMTGQTRRKLSLGIPALDEIASIDADGSKRFMAVALPWEPAGETPFVVAQALAKQGRNPVCIHPSWSPYWDGALRVRRYPVDDLPGLQVYENLMRTIEPGQPVIIDQFSRLHWDTATSHADREDVAREAGRKLLSIALRKKSPVITFIRRKTRDIVRMSVEDLRSDGALEYDTDVLVMVDPHPETATADLLVVKHRDGPTGLRTGVPWPVLPRTIYRRANP
jgi:hypothetical protein